MDFLKRCKFLLLGLEMLQYLKVPTTPGRENIIKPWKDALDYYLLIDVYARFSCEDLSWLLGPNSLFSVSFADFYC
jgi:hypothetical protein